MAMIVRNTGDRIRRILAISMVSLFIITSVVFVDGPDGSDPPDDRIWPDIWTLRGPMDLHDIPSFFPYMQADRFTDHYIVQFDHPVTERDKELLRNADLILMDYIPDHAFVVRNVGGDLEDLKDDVRYIPLPSFMKISPVIWEAAAAGELEDQFDTMVAETFIPSGDAFNSLLTLGEVQQVSSTRYHVKSSSYIDIASIHDVKWVEPLPQYSVKNDISRGIIDVDTMWNLYGYDGTGETVAVADTGLDTGVDDHNTTGDIHSDFDNRVILRNWAGSSPNDGHGHGTHVAGSVAGNGARSNGNIKGMATNATLVFQAIATDSGSLATPGNLSDLFKQAYDLGARVHTNSWGSDGSYFWGRYIASCYDVDWSMFYYPDQLILFAAGNEGTDSSPADGKVDAGSVSPPATAKSTLSVGASENVRSSGGLQTSWVSFGLYNNPVRSDHVSNNANGLAGFSSRGPTRDNRQKPEVVAPGTNILSTKSSIPGSSGGWGGYNLDYLYMGGTSMATPITAGMATLVRQYFNQTHGEEQILASLIKATIINGAVDLTPGQYGSSNPTTQEINSRPDNDQGWGRINLKESLHPESGQFTYENHWEGLTTGQNFSRVFRVNSNDELRLTLAWSDYPGSFFAGKQLVNDLDLVLTAPDGTIYHGNDFSAPFNDTRDSINPVEGITISDPSMGWWKMEVKAVNVPLGPQHFAMVASGNITEFITNSMVFDRRYYSTDDGIIQIQLTGKDLIGSASIQVNLTSSSDPLGRVVTLTEEGDYGSFVGTIMSSNTSTEDPGKLYVEPEDTIYAWYSNSEFGYFYDATAVAKRPTRAALWYLPENHLVYSLGDTVTFKGASDPGTEVEWTVDGSGLGWRELNDKGSPLQGDETAGDGRYSSRFYISEDMWIEGDVILKLRDPYLGHLYYRQFPLTINTSIPRAPTELKARAIPEGNGVELSWKKTGGSKLDHHIIYMNKTPLNLSYDIDNWVSLFSTDNGGNHSEVFGLVDGVDYYFRVSSVWEGGNTSSPSDWAHGIPEDSVSPTLSIDGEPYTLAGDAVIEFSADDDLALIEVEYYHDEDRDGMANDNGSWMPAGSSYSSTFLWNTREEAGGPGNLDRMILRARGADEVPNLSNWTEFPGYAVDNIGPSSLELDWYPARITNHRSYDNLLGTSEALSSIELYVNDDLHNTTTVGQSGLFGISLVLEEGYNLVNLTGYDRHGAGPVITSYEFTLDTMTPAVGIEEFNHTIEIHPEGVDIRSNSFDRGLDPEFTMIANHTWELELPTGQIWLGYGPVFHVDFEELGVHSLTLTIKDLANNINSTMIELEIVDTTSPEIIVVGPTMVDEDTTVEFSSEGTLDNDPCTISNRCSYYNWTFWGPGGWSYSSERWETTVVFPDPGFYSGRLVVMDPSGNPAQEDIVITVNDITPPDGTIEGPVKVIAGEDFNLTAVFGDNSPDLEESGTFDWVINFIDDYGASFKWGEDEGTNISYSFLDTGNYTFELTVTDPSGNARKVSHKIWIWEPPVVKEDEKLSKSERSWVLIVMIAVGVLLILLISALVIWRVTRENLHDVDWADEEDDLDELDDIDLDEEEEEIEFEEDDEEIEELDEW